MDVNKRIIELAKLTGKGDFPLEKEIGLSRGSLFNWRNDKNKPTSEALTKLADYFNVSVDYLLGRDEKKTPTEKVSAGEIENLFAQNGITPDKLNSLPDNKKKLIMSLVKDMIDSSNK